MFYDYTFAIVSALLWALSAPILNIGLKNIPQQVKLQGILTGLFVSLLTGSLLLLIILYTKLNAIHLSLYLFLAGVFTFPVATGLYYFSGYVFKGKIEVAAQFAKVKPIFSVLLAVVILREILSYLSYISLLLISIGLCFYIVGSFQGKFRVKAVFLGILTALAWAIGEMFMKLGLSSSNSIIDTFSALASGTVISAILIPPFIISLVKQQPKIKTWITPFIAHGVLSIGFAYSAFFESIKRIGLGQTVLVNAFWPILAVFIVFLISKIKKEECHIPKYVWYAAPFLVTGSILQVIKLL